MGSPYVLLTAKSIAKFEVIQGVALVGVYQSENALGKRIDRLSQPLHELVDINLGTPVSVDGFEQLPQSLLLTFAQAVRLNNVPHAVVRHGRLVAHG